MAKLPARRGQTMADPNFMDLLRVVGVCALAIILIILCGSRLLKG